jgi:predicted permease
VATALLISATLLLTSYWRLGRVPLGFDGEKVATVEMRLLGSGYREPAAVAAFQRRLIERVRAIPGVAEAGLTSAVPFRGVDFTLTPTRLGEEREYSAQGRFVDAGFFDVLRIPLRRGRLLTEADQPGSRKVAVISEAYARKVFGDADPIGQRLDYRGPVEIVGVVGDVRYVARDLEPREAIYLPRAQYPEALMCVVLRAVLPPEQVIPALRRAIHELDPRLPTMLPTTIDRIIDASVAGRRFYTASTAAFAAIALVLTIVGIAAVVARVVAERHRELAIRSALGATLGHLVSQASRDGLAAVATGVAVGLAGAYAGSVLLAQFLFQVAPRSPAAYAGVASLVVVVAGVAAWLAARRVGAMPLAATLRAD